MNADTGNKRNIWRGLLSVIPAAGGAIFTFFALIFLFLALGLFGWSDGGDPKYLRRLETTTNITCIISSVAAFIVFVAIIMRINRKESKQ